MGDGQTGDWAFTQFRVHFDDGVEYSFSECGAKLFVDIAMCAVSSVHHGYEDAVGEVGVILFANISNERHHVSQRVGGKIFCLGGDEQQV